MFRCSTSLRLSLTIIALIAALICSGQPLAAEVLDKVANIGGTQLEYKVVLPNGYDAAKAYPAILAFGGGPQTMEMVEATLERNWREQAEKSGLYRHHSGGAQWRFVLRGWRACLSRISRQAACRFQSSAKQISHRRRLQWRTERVPHRLSLPAILLVCNRPSRVPPGQFARAYARAGQTLHFHVRRRKGYGVAAQRAAASREIPEPGIHGRIQRGEGRRPRHAHARRQRRGAPLSAIGESPPGLRQVIPPDVRAMKSGDEE